MAETILNRRQISDLIAISAGMLRLKSIEGVCQTTAEAVVKHSVFARCVVSLLEPDDTFVRLGFGGLNAKDVTVLRDMPRSTLESMQEQLAKKFLVGRSYYLPHDEVSMTGLKSTKKGKPKPGNQVHWHPDDFLFIPLYNPDNQIIGLISVDDPTDGLKPTEDKLLPLELFATQTAAVLENLRNLERQQEMYERLRDQQMVVLELSTPVIQVWDKVLVLPLIGSVDSARAQQIMENVLVRISETGSVVIIIDITGVPVIDTLVASHLIKTVSAARLLGAKTIITGINPEVAQTLVHLGVELSEISTKSNLARGISAALEMTGKKIVESADK